MNLPSVHTSHFGSDNICPDRSELATLKLPSDIALALRTVYIEEHAEKWTYPAMSPLLHYLCR